MVADGGTPQTVADEKRVVDEQRRQLDEEVQDFQRRKVSGRNTLRSHKPEPKRNSIPSPSGKNCEEEYL